MDKEGVSLNICKLDTSVVILVEALCSSSKYFSIMTVVSSSSFSDDVGATESDVGDVHRVALPGTYRVCVGSIESAKNDHTAARCR